MSDEITITMSKEEAYEVLDAIDDRVENINELFMDPSEKTKFDDIIAKLGAVADRMAAVLNSR